MAPTIFLSLMAVALFTTVLLVNDIFASGYVVHQSSSSILKPGNLPNRPDASWVNCQGCGLLLNTRIVGGQDADIRDFPWTVEIRKNGRHTCGGSIIRNRYVLTAAHCVADHDASLYTVHAVITDLHQETGFVSKIEYVTLHPQYDRYTANYDVAILRLTKRLPIGTRVQTICLHTTEGDDDDLVGQNATVSGWGALNECEDYYDCPFEFPTHLQKLEVPIVSNVDCKAAIGHLNVHRLIITDQMLCAGHVEGGSGTCMGDSGGPLVWNSNGVWTQVGIVTHVIGCGQANIYDFYARVSEMTSWIAQHTPGPNEC